MLQSLKIQLSAIFVWQKGNWLSDNISCSWEIMILEQFFHFRMQWRSSAIIPEIPSTLGKISWEYLLPWSFNSFTDEQSQAEVLVIWFRKLNFSFAFQGEIWNHSHYIFINNDHSSKILCFSNHLLFRHTEVCDNKCHCSYWYLQ